MRRMSCVMMGASLALLTSAAYAQNCVRPAPGSVVAPPADLYSANGVLNVAFNYKTDVDEVGRTLFCFVTPDGLESPTLHVKPGDTLHLSLHNVVPDAPSDHVMPSLPDAAACGDSELKLSSVNVHFHGLNVAPHCHQDEVLYTIVNTDQTFEYTLNIPKNEPPGLYWYHPHVHPFSHNMVQGGATGAIIVDGIEQFAPEVAGLPARTILLRDQVVDPNAQGKRARPASDVTLNFVPVPWPKYPPAIIQVKPGAREFWRFANTASDTIAVLELRYDGVAQPLDVVGIDGVPVGSGDAHHQGHARRVTRILVPPAGRAEFIVTAPDAQVKSAELMALKPDNGPDGDATPSRRIAVVEPTADAAVPAVMPAAQHAPGPERFGGLDSAHVDAKRHLYFSEVNFQGHESFFFITVEGQQEQQFYLGEPPAITTTQGAVEDWVIENRSNEVHEFHIHQIHFQVREMNGHALPASERLIRDTVQIPYWSGKGPYPSVTVRMDFRGQVVGDFVYHCHILDHEDGGMMAVIRVLPKTGG